MFFFPQQIAPPAFELLAYVLCLIISWEKKKRIQMIGKKKAFNPDRFLEHAKWAVTLQNSTAGWICPSFRHVSQAHPTSKFQAQR